MSEMSQVLYNTYQLMLVTLPTEALCPWLVYHLCPRTLPHLWKNTSTYTVQYETKPTALCLLSVSVSLRVPVPVSVCLSICLSVSLCLSSLLFLPLFFSLPPFLFALSVSSIFLSLSSPVIFSHYHSRAISLPTSGVSWWWRKVGWDQEPEQKNTKKLWQ